MGNRRQQALSMWYLILILHWENGILRLMKDHTQS
jgi:hypothetical protein